MISIILSWHFIKGGTIIGCDGSGPCEQVLSSKWSVIAGKVPVSGMAMGAYLTMLIAIFYTGTDTETTIRRLAWTVMLVLAGAFAGMAIWFTIVQKFIIGQLCPYCLTEHTIGMLIAVIIIRQAVKETTNYKAIKPMAIGLLVAALLATSQIIFTRPAAYQDGTAQAVDIPTISNADSPIVGSANAPYIIKVLFDYNCPHCQKLHGMLNQVISRYHDKIAFVLCPAPLNTQCNAYIPFDVDAYKNSCDLAKIGMTVWFANHKAFADFDKWMFTADAGNEWQPRSTEAAKAKAIELIGQAKFDTASSSLVVQQYIQASVQLYGETVKTGRGGVPKLMFGSNWVIPELTNADDLINILQKSLSVPKP